MQSLAVTKRIIKDSKTSMILAVIVSLVFGTLSVVLFPAIKAKSSEMQKLLETMPPEFFKALNIANTNLGDFDVYIATRYLGLIGIIIFSVFVIGWSGRIAKDAETGTLALMLAQPLKRIEVYAAHLLAMLIQCMLLITIIDFSILLPAILIGEKVTYLNWLKFSLHLFLTLATFGSITIMFSTMLMNKAKAISVAGAIFLGSYLLDLFAKLLPDLEKLRYLSLLYYYGDPVEIIKEGILRSESLLIFLLTAVICILAGGIIFKHKDLPNG